MIAAGSQWYIQDLTIALSMSTSLNSNIELSHFYPPTSMWSVFHLASTWKQQEANVVGVSSSVLDQQKIITIDAA